MGKREISSPQLECGGICQNTNVFCDFKTFACDRTELIFEPNGRDWLPVPEGRRGIRRAADRRTVPCQRTGGWILRSITQPSGDRVKRLPAIPKGSDQEELDTCSLQTQ